MAQKINSYSKFLKVLLSYPKEDDLSTIQVEDSSGTIIFETQRFEKALHPDMEKPDVVQPYNAYSAPGDVQV